ncbi:MAG: aspartate--tRNA(Asn) ligase [Archaeoglobaceae archaeon]|nr:aspartate--tRNA(Asn) ligase [Archaeoglobaceae archaeon]MCX8152645.1 aspartate--tRNA(Asn) ligase [Archaeoglobaceae archaeon]MDW8014073.1 aspartate--tRNA(Asn) ligase [Archaeoglobaceae archaeon]
MRKFTAEISPKMDGEKVKLCGWIHEVRDLGGLIFLILRDREGFAQITLPKKVVDPEVFSKARKIKRESVVEIEGEVKAEEKAPNGFEIIPKKILILNEADTPLPLDVTEKVPAELDTRLDNRFLDLRRPKVQAVFRVRHQVLKSTRDFLCKEGFIEVQTPKIVSTATEGGTELFPVSYFEREAFLNQSPQLYKQMLMSAGFDRVFEIGPIFRAEQHNTTRHLNEATSIDIEVSFTDHEGVMKVLEDLIVYTCESVSNECEKFLKILNVEVEVPEKPFERISYDEALKIASKKEEIPWGEDLSTNALKLIGEEIGNFYFIVDWPTKIKPFYVMPYEEKPEISKSFDLMHSWLELASGAQRIHRYDALVESIRSRGLNPESFQFYLDSFRFGIPPHAGWGLGVERFLMSILKLNNIREATLFPRDRIRLVP